MTTAAPPEVYSAEVVRRLERIECEVTALRQDYLSDRREILRRLERWTQGIKLTMALVRRML